MSIRDVIAANLAGLTPQLRLAAEYVATHPAEIATQSLRSVARQKALSPASFTRLAKALGYQNYDALKDACIEELQGQQHSLAKRAEILQQHQQNKDHAPLLWEHCSAVQHNLNELMKTTDMTRLNQVADLISTAPKVTLLGTLASGSIISFWYYIARMALQNWQLVSENNGQLAVLLNQLQADHCAILLSQSPHARWSVNAAREIADSSAYLIVLTDSIRCPALPYADFHFIIREDSPQFFSSYASMLVFIEALMGMVISRSGKAASQHIANIEDHNYRMGIYIPD